MYKQGTGITHGLQACDYFEFHDTRMNIPGQNKWITTIAFYTSSDFTQDPRILFVYDYIPPDISSTSTPDFSNKIHQYIIDSGTLTSSYSNETPNLTGATP